MVKYILLAFVVLMQLSCGGGSGSSSGGSGGGSGRKRQSLNLQSFRGAVFAQPGTSQTQFQRAVDAFMSAVINPTSENLGNVSGSSRSANSGIRFSGSLGDSNFRFSNGSSIRLVVADDLRGAKGGSFNSTFGHYVPGGLSSNDRPYINLRSGGNCIGTFRAYFEDQFGDITLEGESIVEGGELQVLGQIHYENDSCYCDKNSCPVNYCDFLSGSGRKARGRLGDFKVLYKDLFSRACNF